MKRRFLASLAIGAIVAGALVAWDDSANHAALAASAARSAAHGGHQTVASILTAGFIFTTAVVTLIVFVLATVAARRRLRKLWRATPPAGLRGSGDSYETGRRRRRAGAGW